MEAWHPPSTVGKQFCWFGGVITAVNPFICESGGYSRLWLLGKVVNKCMLVMKLICCFEARMYGMASRL